MLNTNVNSYVVLGRWWATGGQSGQRQDIEFQGSDWHVNSSFVTTSDVLAKARARADNDILAMARTAVPPDCNQQQLIDGNSGSVTIMMIKVKGYIQST